jgi:hypothetical protein
MLCGKAERAEPVRGTGSEGPLPKTGTRTVGEPKARPEAAGRVNGPKAEQPGDAISRRLIAWSRHQNATKPLDV